MWSRTKSILKSLDTALSFATSRDGLLLIFLAGGTVLFAVLYASFFAQIWSESTHPPDLNSQAVYLASLLAASLGTAFAVTLGIQRQDPSVEEKRVQLGATLFVEYWRQKVAQLSVLTYLLVGTAGVVTVSWNQVQSPAPIKAFAAAFIGYFIAAVTAAVTGPGKTGDGAAE